MVLLSLVLVSPASWDARQLVDQEKDFRKNWGRGIDAFSLFVESCEFFFSVSFPIYLVGFSSLFPFAHKNN